MQGVVDGGGGGLGMGAMEKDELGEEVRNLFVQFIEQ
jgi:hypothetical protein